MARIDCPRMETCALFPLFKSPGFLEVWKANYCLGKFPLCLRYQKFLRNEKVPPDLLPDGKFMPRP